MEKTISEIMDEIDKDYKIRSELIKYICSN